MNNMFSVQDRQDLSDDVETWISQLSLKIITTV